ncbi:MAG TPA: hypothetical protein VGX03_24065 [Candidatus Binatia bacterium]|jgi:hypothetical protein|nr:hypothetical protein [Candidatus Binatia bacterium]
MAEAGRSQVLKIFAVLFALLAVSNLLKPLQLDEQTGFVFFGQKLTGTANAIAGPLFGIYLLVYALGIWRMKRFALPMGHAYATYVVLNLIMFTAKNPKSPGVGPVIFGIVYAVGAIGVSCGAAYLLTKHKAELS